MSGQVAKDFIAVKDSSQAGGARLGAQPGLNLPQKQGHEEHSFGFVQMSDVKNGHSGLAFRGVEDSINVQGLAFDPVLEAGGGEQAVEGHSQFQAVLFGKEGLDGEDAQFGHGGLLDAQDELGNVQVLTSAPGRLEDVGQQDVLPALDGIGLYPDEGQKGRDRTGDSLPQQFLVLVPGKSRGLESLQDTDGLTGLATGGVDGEFGRIFQLLQSLWADPPLLQTPGPGTGYLLGILIGAQPFAPGIIQIDPGAKLCGGQFGEGQKQIGHIALGVNDNGRDALQGCFLQKVNAQPRLAAAGHAHTDGVGGQVPALVEHRLGEHLTLLRVVAFAQV